MVLLGLRDLRSNPPHNNMLCYLKNCGSNQRKKSKPAHIDCCLSLKLVLQMKIKANIQMFLLYKVDPPKIVSVLFRGEIHLFPPVTIFLGLFLCAGYFFNAFV